MNSITKIFALSLFCLFCNHVQAIEIQGTRNIDVSKYFEQSKPASVKLFSKKAPKFKMLATLHGFHVVRTADLSGTIKPRYIPNKNIKRILKARLTDSSSFYINGYKIEVVPVNLDRKTRELGLKLNVFKTYGGFQQVEESLGSMQVSGEIRNIKGELVFLGNKQQVFKNKTGHPKLSMMISPKKRVSNRISRNHSPTKNR